MFSLTINYRDHASPMLEALKGVVSENEIAEAVAQAEINLFRVHLLANGTNKHNWPTTSFWMRAAKSLSWSESPGGLTISISQIGAHQRFAGGDIYPTGSHVHLSIPARAEAYGHLPGDFTNLRLAFHRVGNRVKAFALVEADNTQMKTGQRRGKAKSPGSQDSLGGGVYYWLVDSVSQEPDPSVLPDDHEIAAAIEQGLKGLLDEVRAGER